MGRAENPSPSVLLELTELPMAKVDDLSRSPIPLDQSETLISVVELSRSSWLVGAVVPGVPRQPLKNLMRRGLCA